MRELILCLFILSTIRSVAQGNSISWAESPKDLSFILISIDSASYDYYVYPEDSESKCTRPVSGYEKWIELLMQVVRSTVHINTDSIQITIPLEVDSTGQLNLYATDTRSNELEYFFAMNMRKLGPWTPKSDCNKVNIRIASKKLETYTVLDESAQFPGGIKAFYSYLSKKLKYPELAQRLGIEGRVFVQFIVEKDGTISSAKVVKGIGAGCDEEALRVISEMPRWIPGKHKGEPVRQKMIQNILFKFSNQKNKKRGKKKGN